MRMYTSVNRHILSDLKEEINSGSTIVRALFHGQTKSYLPISISGIEEPACIFASKNSRHRRSGALIENDKEYENSDNEFLTTQEAANFLRVSVGVLRNLTSNGKFRFYKLGRRNRYKKEELRALLLSEKRGA